MRCDHGGGKPRLFRLPSLLAELSRRPLRQHPGVTVCEAFGVEILSDLAQKKLSLQLKIERASAD